MQILINTILQHWKAITLACLALITARITALSLWPVEQLPNVPGNDKTHHLIAYAGLLFPMALRRPRYMTQGAVFFFSWGSAIELIQPWFNLYAEWLDLMANTAGLTTGWLLASAARHTVAFKWLHPLQQSLLSNRCSTPRPTASPSHQPAGSHSDRPYVSGRLPPAHPRGCLHHFDRVP